VTGSVSAKTSYLLAGEAGGGKLDKARKLGVPVIEEAALLEMIEKGPAAAGE
jgi:DNA ligase (NAD+)